MSISAVWGTQDRDLLWDIGGKELKDGQSLASGRIKAMFNFFTDHCIISDLSRKPELWADLRQDKLKGQI